jgi:hypothetical protein
MWITDSMLKWNIKKMLHHIKEKVDDADTRTETSHRKFLCQMAAQILSSQGSKTFRTTHIWLLETGQCHRPYRKLLNENTQIVTSYISWFEHVQLLFVVGTENRVHVYNWHSLQDNMHVKLLVFQDESSIICWQKLSKGVQTA